MDRKKGVIFKITPFVFGGLKLFSGTLLRFFKFSFGHKFENFEVFVFGMVSRKVVNQLAIGFEKQGGRKPFDTIGRNGIGITEIVFKNFDAVFFVFGIEFYGNEVLG